MSTEKKSQPEPAAEEFADAPTEDVDAAAAADAYAASEEPVSVAGIVDELAALQAELAESKDRALRAVAEAENVRRRADKERADTLRFGASNLAKELLPVVDNLRRAVDSIPEADREGNEVLKNLLVGVEMTEKMLLDALSKNAVVKIDPLDRKFDYGEHQAIQEITGTDKPAGTVVQVLQPGYKIHDRLLRPAMVIVAKGDAAEQSKDGPDKIDTTA